MPSGSGQFPSGLSTSSDSPVTAITLAGGVFANLLVVNTGVAAGFITYNQGLDQIYFSPAVSSSSPGGIYLPNLKIGIPGNTVNVQISRIPGGSNLTGVYVYLL
jgi:hypothetical protein